MAKYKKTIVKNKPGYLDKNLLLINAYKDGLFLSENGSYIQIKVTLKGEISVCEITDKFQCNHLDISLREIGKRYLHLKDPSVNQMLKYFVLPEMEVERIFNNVRYNYLKAIYLSGLEPPSQFINACYNKAFQSLAGLKVYQGNTNQRKVNDSFWQEAGFISCAKQQICWEKERYELQRILFLIRDMNRQHTTQKYAELIAIKPGFHEIWTHPDYFEHILKGNTPRERVFRMLRGQGELSELSLDKMPPEINKNSYFSYAPCNVTEGPFVFRKNIAFSYFDEIRKIRSKDNLCNLQEKFYILDYLRARIDSRKSLSKFLRKAERFKSFL